MTTKTVAEFTVSYCQVLDHHSELVDELPNFAEDANVLRDCYRAMVLTRVFDTKAIALQRTGKLGTYPSTLGQEAIGVGVGSAMQAEDVLCPYYRENAAMFWRGVTMEEIFIYWGGSELGSDFSGPKQDLPVCIPIASQTLHAVGVASAMKMRKQARAAVAFIGDGGTSRGDFYEAVNVAGAWQLPVVFIVNNNQWAISVPRKAQTKAETFVQKGFAGGVPGIQVDGNDVLAVRQATEEALAKAYKGKGATVIEAITYRMCDHTTADDASRYRPEGELEQSHEKDPVLRLKNYLMKIDEWDESQEKALQNECAEKVATATENYLATPVQPPESMFDYLYETLPEALELQRQELLDQP